MGGGGLPLCKVGECGEGGSVGAWGSGGFRRGVQGSLNGFDCLFDGRFPSLMTFYICRTVATATRDAFTAARRMRARPMSPRGTAGRRRCATLTSPNVPPLKLHLYV